MRDWLFGPSWRSAVVVEQIPTGAFYLGDDRHGWRYWQDGRRIVTRHA